jgi:hypothetical protein
MNATKIVTILIADVILLGFALLGVAGMIGWLTLDRAVAVTAIVAPCLGAAGVIYGAKHIFEDPEAVTKLKTQHATAILDLEKKLRDAEANWQKKESQLHEHHAAEIKTLKSQVSEWQRTALANQKKPQVTGIRPIGGSA